ncbi:MAG TPA: hypothetical protein VLH16_01315, partial [Bacteroidales bacterium]|nr:hypothetical protein [Bacteroidales bacterium]
MYPTGKCVRQGFFAIAFILLVFQPSLAQSPQNIGKYPKLRFNGYLTMMPSAIYSSVQNRITTNGLIHNRLNFGFLINEQWSVTAEVRNRVITGAMVSEIPLFVDWLDNDPGLLDLSKTYSINHGSVVHTMSDRLFVELRTGQWNIRAGRQRINWGINMISNPNDLFNTYSFFDFDYVERPGADAMRIQYFVSGMSRLEFAAAPAKHIRNATAALLYSWNTNGYDIQIIAGYYRNRLTVGGGWAGNIMQSGFKGEITLFNDLQPNDTLHAFNAVAAVSFDHRFDNNIFAVVEFLYNGGYSRSADRGLLITDPLSADNIAFSRFGFTGSVMYPFSPIFTGSLATIWYP